MARRVDGWRKLAGSAWGPPMDPQFYGDLELDAGELPSYIEEGRRGIGAHITMTHLVGRAVAHGLAAVPELRVRLARGREHEREKRGRFLHRDDRGRSGADRRQGPRR